MALKDTFLIKEGEVVQFPAGGRGGQPAQQAVDPKQIVNWTMMELDKSMGQLRKYMEQWEQFAADPAQALQVLKKHVSDMVEEISEAESKIKGK